MSYEKVNVYRTETSTDGMGNYEVTGNKVSIFEGFADLVYSMQTGDTVGNVPDRTDVYMSFSEHSAVDMEQIDPKHKVEIVNGSKTFDVLSVEVDAKMIYAEEK